MIFARARKPPPAANESNPRPPAVPRPAIKRARPARKPRPWLVPRPARKPVVLEFQTDAIEIEERKPPFFARLTLYAVVLFIGGLVYWASVSRIEEIVVAPGRLVTTKPTIVIQPLETSVIRSIDVRPGEVVEAGEQLATLDPTFSAADVGALKARIAALDAQIDRIEAELAGRAYEAPPDATPDQRTQAQLFSQRAAAYAAKLRDYDAQIAHAQATLASGQAQEKVLEQRIAGLEQIDQMRQTLAEMGSGSRLSYLQSRDVSLDTQATLSGIRGEEAEASHSLDQARAERQNFIEDYRRQTLEALVDLKDKQASASEDMKKAELRRAMAVLRAPADAAVLDVAQRSIGSVVTAAEPLFTMVPLNVPLVAEVSVAARDIGHLAAGDPARIKFDAFPFQEHGTIEGKVTSISHDSFADQPGDGSSNPAPKLPFYRVRVALGENTLTGLPQGFRMLPGMTVEAEIDAGQRTIISYFLYPLLRGLDESLREP